MHEAYAPDLAGRVLELYEHAKERGSRQTFGRGKRASTTVWMGEHEDREIANPLALWSGSYGSGISVLTKEFRERRTPEEMACLVELLRRLAGTSEVLDEAVAKDYRTFCNFPADRVLATAEDLEAFKRVLDEAAVRASPAA